MLSAFITRQDTCDTDAVLRDRRDPRDCKELINEGIMLESKLDEGFAHSFFFFVCIQKDQENYIDLPLNSTAKIQSGLFKSIVFLSSP